MKPGVTCQKLVSLNKNSPVSEKNTLIYIFFSDWTFPRNWVISPFSGKSFNLLILMTAFNCLFSECTQVALTVLAFSAHSISRCLSNELVKQSMCSILFWCHFWIMFLYHFQSLQSKDQYMSLRLYFELFAFSCGLLWIPQNCWKQY